MIKKHKAMKAIARNINNESSKSKENTLIAITILMLALLTVFAL